MQAGHFRTGYARCWSAAPMYPAILALSCALAAHHGEPAPANFISVNLLTLAVVEVGLDYERRLIAPISAYASAHYSRIFNAASFQGGVRAYPFGDTFFGPFVDLHARTQQGVSNGAQTELLSGGALAGVGLPLESGLVLS